MRSALSLAIAFVLLVALSACSSPEGSSVGSVTPAIQPVDSDEARRVVEDFLAALSSGDSEAAGDLMCGRALEASRTLSGITSIELISLTEDPAYRTPKSKVRVFEAQCDVDYSRGAIDQSGVYVYRLRVARTADGLKIECFEP